MLIKEIINESIDLNKIEVIENKNKIKDLKPKRAMKYTFEDVHNTIISTFETQAAKRFIGNENTINQVKTIACYLVRDKRFFKSPLLNRNLNTPSFKKGLLIVGDFGVGKTALLKTIPLITNSYFTYDLTVDLVSEFESLTSSDRSAFMTKHKFGRRIYDDLGTEKKASNYGLVNLMKDIFESRYGNNFQNTLAACNYDENNPLDIDSALDKLGKIYGSRVLDRLYEMFNIVEFKGKSLRR